MRFGKMILDKGGFWALNEDDTCLYYLNNDDKRLVFVADLGVPYIDNLRFCNLIKVNDSIVCVPKTGKVIAIYNISERTIEHIPIDICENVTIYSDYIGVETYNNKLFVFGWECSNIVIIDLPSKTIESVIVFSENSIGEINYSGGWFTGSHAVIDNWCYVAFSNCNKLLELNFDTYEYNVHTIGTDKNGFQSICALDHEVALLTKNPLEHGIMVWRPDGGVVESYASFPSELKYCENYIIYTLRRIDNYLVGISLQRNQHIIINRKSKEVKMLPEFIEGTEDIVINYYMIGNEIIYCNHDVYGVYNITDKTVIISQIDMDKDVARREVKTLLKRNIYCIEENKNRTLETFIDTIYDFTSMNC